jgi:hypothetical protein
MERGEVMMRRIGMQPHPSPRAAHAGITVVVAVVVLAGCASARTTGGAAPSSVPASAATSSSPAPAATSNSPAPVAMSGAAFVSARAFGTGSADELLTLTPPGIGDRPVVPESAARTEVDHPLSAPTLLKPVLFTLARATASMLGWEGTAAAPVFRSTLAWVGVFEVDPNAEHGCPAEPAPTPASFPPLQAHYYFAVLVDATTGAQATWNEDMSGLLMRQCAGVWSSPPNHS